MMIKMEMMNWDVENKVTVAKTEQCERLMKLIK